ncbi:TetR family transcriptional regulator [Conexibacter sp. W3-3-2]|uniref:TetR/AcrR family transcriptional regulator n=1 Tax=Conexibacter sp. W3-3-2 TaxID=2675227 RepID=UPI0012B8D5F9|nr:TetR/AcrR family transcriptional regulator [Conexibacter sp. W3-3-2]MTD45336.1 TetR family transcriptional regulator [Conexibacter sp. W3-3-2]
MSRAETIPEPPPTPRVYGGQSADSRAQARRARLLDAAFELVAEHGRQGVTIAAVCQASELNKRYFYESFTDLDELLAAVTRRLGDDAIATAIGAIDPTDDGDARIRSAVHALVADMTDDPRRARVLFGAVPLGDTAAGHRSTTIHRIVAAATAEGREILGDAAEARIAQAAAMLVGGTAHVLLDWLDGRLEVDRDAMTEDLVASWLAIRDAISRPDR